MIDKNNWYIEEKELTGDQYRKVCKYLLSNYPNMDKDYEHVELVAKGMIRGNDLFDVTGVIDGEYFVDNLPSEDFEKCAKITYQDFVEHLLNPSKISPEDVSKSTGTKPQDESENVSQGITDAFRVIQKLCIEKDVAFSINIHGDVEIYTSYGGYVLDIERKDIYDVIDKMICVNKIIKGEG